MIEVLHTHRNRGNDSGLSSVAHAGRELPKIVEKKFGSFDEETRVLSEKLCGFRRKRSNNEMLSFVGRQVQELRRASSAQLNMCRRACDSVGLFGKNFIAPESRRG